MSEIDGWWFGVRGPDGEVRESRGERRAVRVGETLAYVGTPVVCLRGLHASPDPLLALREAPDTATVVCRVRLGGLVVGPEQGKYAAQRRTTLWVADCEAALRRCATDYAERALLREREATREPDARLWAAVEAARAYARGEIDVQTLQAAARAASELVPYATLLEPRSAPQWAAVAAAWAVEKPLSWVATAAAEAAALRAWAAAWEPAWAAWAAAEAARAAQEWAAWAAAEAERAAQAWVAQSAAEAARVAAREAERRWQSEHLTEALMALAPEAAKEGTALQ